MRNNEVDCDVSNSYALSIKAQANEIHTQGVYLIFKEGGHFDVSQAWDCLLYTSDAADDIGQV